MTGGDRNMEQLDLFDILGAETKRQQVISRQEAIEKELMIAQERFGKQSFEKIKDVNALNVKIDDLPWKPLRIDPNLELCDVKVIIPPYALSLTEQSRLEGKFGDYSDAKISLYDLWAAYNHCIWNYDGHDVDWCGAYKLLAKYRNRSAPIWVRITKYYSKVRFFPESIVEF